MRRFVLLLITLVYCLPAAGMSVQVHFCGDDLEAVSLFGWPNAGCACDADGEEADCCGDELAVFQFEDQQQGSTPLRLADLPSLAIPTPHLPPLPLPCSQLAGLPTQHQGLLRGHAPPHYLRCSQLLI